MKHVITLLLGILLTLSTLAGASVDPTSYNGIYGNHHVVVETATCTGCHQGVDTSVTQLNEKYTDNMILASAGGGQEQVQRPLIDGTTGEVVGTIVPLEACDNIETVKDQSGKVLYVICIDDN